MLILFFKLNIFFFHYQMHPGRAEGAWQRQDFGVIADIAGGILQCILKSGTGFHTHTAGIARLGGSRLQYKGGIAPMTITRCNSLGLLEIDSSNARRGPVLAQAASCYGSFRGDTRAEVLDAPLQ